MMMYSQTTHIPCLLNIIYYCVFYMVQAGESMYCLLEAVAMVPDTIAVQMVSQLDWLKVGKSSLLKKKHLFWKEMYSVKFTTMAVMPTILNS